jgi:hypothetical protein
MINRNRPILHNPSPEQPDPKREQLDSKIEELQKQTISKSLADSFPEWDLNPPSILVRRRRSSFL